VTLHDLLHLDLPDLVPRYVRWFRALFYDRASRHADRVIVPSAFVRDRAVARLGLDPRRIRVIEHSIDSTVFHASGSERESFVLYPARPWPHKNHATLFDGWRELRRARPGLELVLTGGGLEQLALPEGVRSLGRIPRSELAALYRRAAALVFPSRYEGFGQPVLEALASGCPVAAARATAVGEVAGAAAVYFDPDSPEELARAVLEAVDAGPELATRGERRASEFTPARVARLHDEVYAELYGP
jgi:glycosyltransferase involved in cell wall biosynthesis